MKKFKSLLIALSVVIAVAIALPTGLVFGLRNVGGKTNVEQEIAEQEDTSKGKLIDGIYYAGEGEKTGAHEALITEKGAIYIKSDATVTIGEDAIISGHESLYGGAIYVANGGVLNIYGGTITGNTSRLGGAIYVEAGGIVNFYGGTITGNISEPIGESAIGSDGTAAVYAEYGATINNPENCAIEGNTVGYFGNYIVYTVDGVETYVSIGYYKSAKFNLENVPLDYEHCCGYYTDSDLTNLITDGDDLEIYTTYQTVKGTTFRIYNGIHTKEATLDKLSFELNEDQETYNVRGKDGISGMVVIPCKYNGKNVTTIYGTDYDDTAFYCNSQITAVYMTNNITEIGSRAFAFCSGLSGITIPSSVTNIGNQAFSYCSGLTEINYNAINASFGNWLFEGAGNNTNGTVITIGDKVQTVPNGSFGYSKVIKIIIGESVTSFDYSGNETKLTEIVNKSELEISAYNSNYDYAPVVVTDESECGEFTIVDNVVYYTNSNIPNLGKIAVSRAGNNASEITIANDCTEIKNSAFGYNDITKVTIPTNVTKIGITAFNSCGALEYVNYMGTITDWLDIKFGSQWFDLNNVSWTLCLNDQEVTDLQIPNGVTSIPAYAFINCNGLESVTIPSSVTEIGCCAFEYCKNIAVINYNAVDAELLNGGCVFALAGTNTNGVVVNIGEDVETLPYGLFESNSMIKTVYVNSQDFAGADSENSNVYDNALTVYVKDTISNVGESITDEYILQGESDINDYNKYYVNFPVRYPQFQWDGSRIIGCNVTPSGELVIPEGTTEIDTVSGFWHNTEILSVTIPSTLQNMQSMTFYNSYNIVEVINKSDLNIVAGYSGYGYVGYYAAVVLTNENDKGSIIQSNGVKYYVNYSVNPDVKMAIGRTDDSVTEIVLDEDCTAIASKAFEYSNITSATIGSNVTRMGYRSFGYCSNLQTIYYNATNVTSYDNQLFYDCGTSADGTTLIIGDNVTNIPNYMFNNGTGLISVTVGSNVISIGDDAFSSCYKLVEVVNKSNLNIVAGNYDNGNIAYYASVILTNENDKGLISTSNGVRYYVNNNINQSVKIALSLVDTSITNLVLDNDCTGIGYRAFDDRNYLVSVTIPNNVTKIGNYAFSSCNSLSSLTLGSNVANIVEYAFADCYKLAEIVNKSSLELTCGSTDNGYVACYASVILTNENDKGEIISSNGIKYYVNTNVSPSIKVAVGFVDNSDIELMFDNDCTGIGNYAFNYYSGSTTNLVIPASVTNIGMHAFEYVYNLTSVQIGSGVTSIGQNAFYDCYNIETVIIDSASVAALESSDSYLLYYPPTLYIKNTISEIGSYVSFVKQDSSDMTGYDKYLSLASLYPNFYWNGSTVTGYKFDSGDFDGALVIPNGATRIGSYAFSNHSEITSVVIPESVTYIDYYAIYGCNNLQTVTIGSGVTDISYYVFWNNYNLATVFIDSADVAAFDINHSDSYLLSSATKVYVKNTISTIGSYIMNYMILCDQSDSDWEDGYNLYKRPSVLYPDFEWSGTQITGHRGISGDVVIPYGTTYICNGAFSYTSDITSVTIPSTVTGLGSCAFDECSGLTTVIIDSAGVADDSDSYSYLLQYATTVYVKNDISDIGSYISNRYVFDSNSDRVGYNKYVLPSALYPQFYWSGSTITGYNTDDYGTPTGTLVIPEGATYIDNSFGGFSGITRVVLPTTLSGMGHDAGSSCTDVIEVINKSSLNIVAGRSDYGCFAGYAAVVFTTEVGPGSIDESGTIKYYVNTNTSPTTKVALGFTGDASSSELVLDNDCTEIRASAFYNYSGPTTTLIIPESVTKIGPGAFSDCCNISKVFVDSASVAALDSSESNLFRYPTAVYVKDTINEIGDYLGRPFVYDDESDEVGYNKYVSLSVVYTQFNWNGSIITGYNGTPSGEILIPAGATAIENNAFSNCSEITSVIISDTVTSIGYGAFNWCTGLTSVTIGSGVTYIGDDAFGDCINLTEINYNANVTSTYSSFYNSGKTASETVINIGNSVTSIPTYMFNGLFKLKTLTIPESVTRIEYSAFCNCPRLVEIINKSSVELNVGMFSSEGSLPPVIVYDESDRGEFAVSNGVQYYIKSNGVQNTVKIAVDLMDNSTPNIIIDNDCTEIRGAFRSSDNLQSVTMPVSVQKISIGSFGEMYDYNSQSMRFQSIYYTGTIENWCAVRFERYWATNTRYNLYINGNIVEALTIPSGVSEIKPHAFAGCTSLTSLSTGSTLTKIGFMAFDGCFSLRTVVIESTFTEFGVWVFEACNKLATVIIDSETIAGLDYSESYLLNNASTVYVKDTITTVGSYITNSCLPATSDMSGYNMYINLPVKYPQFSWSGTAITGYNDIPSGELVIPSGATGIDSWAFQNNYNITSVVIPDSVTYIYSGAFYDCGNLTSVTLGSGLNYISSDAFSSCEKITEVINKSSLSISVGQTENGYVGYYAAVILPSEEYKGTFTSSNNILYYTNTNSPYTISKTAVCMENTSVGSVTIDSDCAVIKPYAFLNCGLTSITIPNSVTSIGAYAFNSNNYLSEVTIGTGLASVGAYAFYDCPVSTVTIDSATIVTLDLSDSYLFNSVNNVYIKDNISNVGPFITDRYSLQSTSLVSGYNFYMNLSMFIWDGTVITGQNGVRGDVIIPDGTTGIGDNAFLSCSQMTSILIPSSVTSIGMGAFFECYSLRTITIDSADVAAINSSDSGLIGSAGTVYVKNSISDVGSYITNSLVASDSDKAGYNMYVNLSLRYPQFNWSGTVITGYNNTPSGELVIPTGTTGIGEGAFRYCNYITSLSLPSTLTSIGYEAFYNCNGINGTVTIPSSVESIGSYAFYQCSGIDELVIYANVSMIGSYAFEYCYDLISVIIGDNVEEIGSYAFYYCTKLVSVTIGSNVEIIEENAFNTCEKLIEVVNKSSLTLTAGSTDNGWVSYYATLILTNVANKGEITQSNGVRYYVNTHVSPNMKIALGRIDSSVTEVIIADDCTEIAQNAFEYTGITSVTIGTNVTKMGYRSFGYCSYLQTVYFNATNVTTLSDQLFMESGSSAGGTTLIIGNNVTNVPSSIFYSFSGLTTVTVGTNVVSIGDSAFYNCVKLAEVVNKSGLTITAGSSDNGHVAYYAAVVLTNENDKGSIITSGGVKYYVNTNIQPAVKIAVGYADSSMDRIIIANDCTAIGTYAFQGFYNLKTIIISANVSSIGYAAFENCSDLRTIKIDSPSVAALNSTDSYLYNYARTIYVNQSINNIGTLILNGFVQQTSDEVGYNKYVSYSSVYPNFYWNGSMVTGYNFDSGDFDGTLVIPTGATGIGSYAFNYRSQITSVVIPDSVTYIYGYAFQSCSNLATVTIGSGLTGMDDWVFENCYNLATVIIDSASFASVSSSNSYLINWATKVYVKDTISTIGQYITGNLMQSAESDMVGYNMFVSPANIYPQFYWSGTTVTGYNTADYEFPSELVIPNGATSIGSNAFNGNSELTSLVIPDSVTGISDYAFQSCSNLATVTIGSGVTYVNYGAFSDCYSLATVIIDSAIVAGWSSSDSYLKEWATTVYIKDTISNIGSYISSKFILSPSSDKTGYNKYVVPSVMYPQFTWEGSTITGYNTGDYEFPSELVIPEGAKYINSYAFSSRSGLTKVTLPTTLLDIYSDAFYDCHNILEVVNKSSLNIVAGNSDYGWVAYYAAVVFDTEVASGAVDTSGTIRYYVNTNTSPTIKIALGFTGDASSSELVLDSDCTAIVRSAFNGYNGPTTTITIPSMVTSIGQGAFDNCTGLTIVKIDSEIIAGLDQSDCCLLNWATAIYVKDTINTIGTFICGQRTTDDLTGYNKYLPYSLVYDQFRWLGSTITGYNTNDYGTPSGELLIPTGATIIGSSAFYHCTEITSVSIPNTVTRINEAAFRGCTGLADITIPSSVTHIDECAFYGCENASQINFNANITMNYNNSPYIFANAGLAVGGVTLVIGDNVTYIPSRLFAGQFVSYITKVVIGSNVSSIGEGAFGNNRHITEIVNKSSNISINVGDYDYGWLAAYALVVVDNENDCGTFTQSNGVVYYSNNNVSPAIAKTAIGLVNRSASEIVLDNDCVAVKTYAFDYYDPMAAFTTITISESVTNIGYEAFYNADNLRTIIIDSPETAASGGFNSGFISRVYNIYVKDTITNVGSYITDSCNLVDSDMTGYNKYMTYICLYPKFTWNGSTITGYNTSDYGTPSGELVIPDVATGIDNNAFSNIQDLTGVVIPDSVTYIGTGAFWDCSKIYKVTIGSNVSYIGGGAFYCVSLVEVINKSSLNITVGSSEYGRVAEHALAVVNYEGRGTFTTSNNIVYYENATYNIPKTAVSLADSSVNSITFDDGCVQISSYAFLNCYNLTSVVIPDSVTTLLEGAFCYCGNLRTVTIGSGVTTIASRAFDSCPISILIIDSATVAAFDYSSFDGTYLFDYVNNVFIKDTISEVGYIADAFALQSSSDMTGYNLYLNTSIYSWDDTVITGRNGSVSGDVIIPDGTTGISGYVFSDCGDISSVKIPSSMVNIGDYAFDCCSNLYTVILDSATVAGWNSSDCCLLNNARTIYVKNTISSVGVYITNKYILADSSDKSGYNKYVFPSEKYPQFQWNGTTITGYNTSSPLWSNVVVIPDVATAIGDGAFSGNSNITSVTIGSGVTNIVYNAFMYCYNLATLIIDSATVASWESTDLWLYTYAETVYINDSINDVGTEVTEIFVRQEQSDKSGYIKYVRPVTQYTLTLVDNELNFNGYIAEDYGFTSTEDGWQKTVYSNNNMVTLPDLGSYDDGSTEYNFMGWDGCLGSYTVTESTTLYAEWSIIPYDPYDPSMDDPMNCDYTVTLSITNGSWSDVDVDGMTWNYDDMTSTYSCIVSYETTITFPTINDGAYYWYGGVDPTAYQGGDSYTVYDNVSFELLSAA